MTNRLSPYSALACTSLLWRGSANERSQHAEPATGVHASARVGAQLGKCDRTAKRLQDAGRIVVIYIGKDPFVDLERTAARLRGEDKRSRRGRAA